MDGYLPKPIRSQELDEVLEIYSTQKARSGDSAAGAQLKALVGIPDAVNSQELLERIGDDREFLAELVAAFREDYPKQLNLITAALRAGDGMQLTLTAHSLKGALSNLAAQRAAEVAATIEGAGKRADFAGAEAGLQDLEPELARVVEALNALWQETVQ